jgi:hypothetical protein
MLAGWLAGSLGCWDIRLPLIAGGQPQAASIKRSCCWFATAPVWSKRYSRAVANGFVADIDIFSRHSRCKQDAHLATGLLSGRGLRMRSANKIFVLHLFENMEAPE